jgi:hypothetical protein
MRIGLGPDWFCCVSCGHYVTIIFLFG